MRLRTRLLGAVALLAVLDRPTQTDTRNARLTVGATVVRSCSVRTSPEQPGTVALACTRGAETGVMASTSPGVIEVQPREIAVISAEPGQGESTFRFLTVNF